MKKSLLACLFLVLSFSAFAQQTEGELRAAKKAKNDSISKIQKRVDAIQKKLDNLPGWRIGAFGTVGVDLSNFSNWYAQGTPNVSSGSIGLTSNAFANLKQPKYFWRNALNVNLQWQKFDDEDDPTDDDSFKQATDVFNISSLYGYNLTPTLAISTLGEYRTTLLNNFNDPGYLDLGLGGTWTPISNLVIVMHPFNYNIIFTSSEDIYQSSLGAKIVADYTKKIGKVNLKSNFSTFQSYDSSDLSNYTWINSVGFKIFKSFGVGFEFGLRNNKQEALEYARTALMMPNATFASIDNDLQSYWLIGLTYSL
ncbi:MAG: DUF3078 domain-containing protein [Leeuwenhoekiella sp.]